MHLHATNVNDAFYQVVRGVHYGDISTVRTSSRVGDVLQVKEPVMLTYEKPRQRVLLNPARDANPFFHLFESLWMLAGRNDVAPLAFYSSKIAAMASDDGRTFNGAYGYRWRHAENVVWNSGGDALSERVDQLSILIEHLRSKPDSRRAVLQMWDIENDLLKIDITKDVCCLAWDSKFRSPEGDVNIQELAKRFQNNAEYRFPVYSVDTETGNQRLSWMTNAWRVGSKQVYKLGFDDGSFIRLTGDHLLFKKTKVYKGKSCIGLRIEEKQVCELSSGDRVLASLSKGSKCRGGVENYLHFKSNIFEGTYYRNMLKEHREYYQFVTGEIIGEDEIHHKDENKAHNCFTNLERLTVSCHRSYHITTSHPSSKMTKEALSLKGKLGAAARKAKGYAPFSESHKRKLAESAKKRVIERGPNGRYVSESNHKITSIELDGTAPVYDFTVPGNHNAVLENGVLVHNCNTAAYFLMDGNKLNMTVSNRSNDLVLGMLGANVVHFSFLQEYLACCLGVEVGTYTQFTNNLHAYVDSWKPEEWLADTDNLDDDNLMYVGEPYPRLGPSLVKDQKTFDLECGEFIKNHHATHMHAYSDPGYSEPFLQDVAWPMCMAFLANKNKRRHVALEWMDKVAADDWRKAGREWIERRMAKADKPKEKVNDE